MPLRKGTSGENRPYPTGSGSAIHVAPSQPLWMAMAHILILLNRASQKSLSLLCITIYDLWRRQGVCLYIRFVKLLRLSLATKCMYVYCTTWGLTAGGGGRVFWAALWGPKSFLRHFANSHHLLFYVTLAFFWSASRHIVWNSCCALPVNQFFGSASF